MPEPEDYKESKSSVEISLNAKSEAQVKLKVYEDTTTEEMTRIRNLAVSQFKTTLSELGVSWS